MGDDIRVGRADLHDHAVRRLIEPMALQSLEHGPATVMAVRAKGVPVAVAAAVAHGNRQEILSIACLEGARPTPALGWAIAGLRGAGPVVFDPSQPLQTHVEKALIDAGLRPAGPRWDWYELVEEAVLAARSSVTVGTVSTLGSVRPPGYEPHPDDVADSSPVLLTDGRPVAFAVIRRGEVLHWVWVEPRHRRQGVIMQLTAALVDAGLTTARFRVDATNKAMRHVLDAAPAGTVRHLFTEAGWVG